MGSSFKISHLWIRGVIIILLTGIYNNLAAQNKPSSVSPLPGSITTKFATQNNIDLYNTRSVFIENIGQYGETMHGYEAMGKILYGYEGMSMPFLFTAKGIIHLQRKIEFAKEKDENEEPEEAMKDAKVTDRVITIQWLNANPSPEIITEEKQTAYHTYGLIQKKAYAYKKIIYKEMYPGIDIIYSFIPGSKAGFEYSILVKPGADLSLVKMQFGGDIKNIKQGAKTLSINSDIEGISITNPVCFYEDDMSNKVKTAFIVKGNELSFKTDSYDRNKSLVIDPFVSGTGNLTGVNAGIAKDIDYDYAGNVYVSGGGSWVMHQLAKFNSNGILQWTFNGDLPAQSWVFGWAYGGWAVDKLAGNIYLGSGNGNSALDASIIRLNTLGVYDNYITDQDTTLIEIWKMLWDYNGGNPLILVGIGGRGDKSLGIISPPSTVILKYNMTGILEQPPINPPLPGIGNAQDVTDMEFDQLTRDLYTVFSSNFTPHIRCRIYKHHYPYTAPNIVWDTITGYPFYLQEHSNRPYLDGLFGGATDNTANILAINSRYLFYWDGRNVKAFDKNTGGDVATPLTVPYAPPFYWGGIVADECDNVYIGSENGTIRVLHFTAANGFDDCPPDISIPGFPTASVFDLAYDAPKKLLYASGKGFVASFDILSYCDSTVYSLSVITDCANGSATATVNPGSNFPVSYSLYDGTTFISSNASGIFTNLSGNLSYTIVATVGPNCSGPQATANFRLDDVLTLSLSNDATICESKKTTLTAVTNAANFSWTPVTGLNNPAILNPEASPITTTKYYITATTGVCSKKDSVMVFVNPAPVADAGKDSIICLGKNIQLNGTGGVGYLWTPATWLSNAAISNPRVIIPVPGSIVYSLIVTDANGCQSLNTASVSITVQMLPKLFAGNDTAVAINQPVQLTAHDINNNGFINYSWSPAFGLNNPAIANPIAVLDRETTYIITAHTANGCEATDDIKIKVYKGPEIYVPGAFTPNGDGLNDILKAIPIGMKEFTVFSVYDRYGQIVFTTKNANTGWDGTIKGYPQGPSIYVWMAKAIDYKGNVVLRKGTVALIR